MILSYLPINSLLNCRVVNGTWNAIATIWIQDKMEKCVNVEHQDFPRFCADFEKTEVFPISHFTIYLPERRLDHISNLFTKHGSHIRCLEINEQLPETRELEANKHYAITLKKKLQQILLHVSNLRKLTVSLNAFPMLFPDQFIFDEQEHVGLTLPLVEHLRLICHELGPIFLNGLFAMLPNLKILEIGFMPVRQDWNIFVSALHNRMIHTIYVLIDNKSVALWRAMSGPDFPRLKQLYMNIKAESDSTEVAQLLEAQEEFLRYHSESLEILELTVCQYDKNYDNPPRLQFPVMPNLKTLSLNFESGSNGTLSYPLVPIQPYTVPSLRVLKSESIQVTLNQGILDDSAFTSVQEFNLTSVGIGNFRGPDTLLKITSQFPNLKKLVNFTSLLRINDRFIGLPLFANRSVLERIVQTLFNIEHLEWFIVHHPDDMKTVVNFVLSGIPSESGWALSQLTDRVGYEALLYWINPQPYSLCGLRRN